MEVISNKPDEHEVLFEFPVFIVGELAVIFQVSWCPQVETGPGNPQNMMVIPETTDAFF